MSHDATNWALKQRGLKPALKIVLWHLCDRYNPDNGCFPSQETLAYDCEVPRSTLNTYLDTLEKAGLIAREQRRQKGSQKQERTRYYFAFEPGFTPVSEESPSPETGHGSDAEAESRNQPEPSPENGESRVQNLDSNPVREPLTEPVRERETRKRDHAVSGSVINAALTKRVQNFCTGEGYKEGPWPKWGSATVGHIAKMFATLSPEEMDAACEWRDPFLVKCRREGISTPMPLANFFRDRVWEMLGVADKAAVRPVAGGAQATASGKIVVPVFGPVFGAARAWSFVNGPEWFDLPEDLRELVQATYEAHERRGPRAAMNYAQRLGISIDRGRVIFPADFEAQERARRTMQQGYPEAKRLNEAARDRAHVTVDPVFERLKDLCEPVPVGSPMWDEWRDYHEQRGWQFVPTPSGMRVVWFPKGGPEGIEAFARAARERIEGDVHAAAE